MAFYPQDKKLIDESTINDDVTSDVYLIEISGNPPGGDVQWAIGGTLYQEDGTVDPAASVYVETGPSATEFGPVNSGDRAINTDADAPLNNFFQPDSPVAQYVRVRVVLSNGEGGTKPTVSVGVSLMCTHPFKATAVPVP